MASTRKTRGASLLIGAAVVLGGVVLTPLTAAATPHQQPLGSTASSTPQTSSDVLATLGALAKANDKLTEQYNRAQTDLAKAQKDADAASQQASVAQAALAKARKALALSLAAQYTGSSFSHTAALLGSNSGQNYLEKMQTLSYLALHEKGVAAVAAQASSAAADAQRHADALVASALAKRNALTAQQTALSKEIDKQKQLLAKLTAAERASFQNAGNPNQSQLQMLSGGVVAKSKIAGIAVHAALSQLGKPYVWGAAGPDAYDCSGLTMWSYAHAGVSLPHDAAAQQGMGTPVSQSQLEPGDLVFFGSPAYHVGMYIGNGMMVQAPTTGEDVKITSLSYMSDYSGAVRIG